MNNQKDLFHGVENVDKNVDNVLQDVDKNVDNALQPSFSVPKAVVLDYLAQLAARRKSQFEAYKATDRMGQRDPVRYLSFQRAYYAVADAQRILGGNAPQYCGFRDIIFQFQMELHHLALAEHTNTLFSDNTTVTMLKLVDKYILDAIELFEREFFFEEA